MCHLMLFPPAEELYVSDKQGSDADGDGSEQKPFKTPLKVPAGYVMLSVMVNFCSSFHTLSFIFLKCSQALLFAGKEPFPVIYVDSQKEGEVCKPADNTNLL